MSELRQYPPQAVPPSMRPGDLPLLHRIGEYPFQDLCCELCLEEPGIRMAEIYGLRGQRQFGIDIYSVLEDGTVAVGQCKCYEQFTTKDIIKASNDFLKYIGRWSNAGVRRFLLFVACPLDDTKQVDELEKQRKRFKTYGIEYDVWPVRRIVNRLRSRRPIVSFYLPRWVDDICGKPMETATPVQQATSQTNILVESALLEQMKGLISVLSQTVIEQITTLKTAWREGRRRIVFDTIRKIRTDAAKWPHLTPETRAQVLCVEAGLELDLRNNVAQAHELAQEAHRLAPMSETYRLLAHVAYRQTGVHEALSLIENIHDIGCINLKAALHLEAHELEACHAALVAAEQEFGPSAETLRVRTLWHLTQGQLPEALTHITQALSLEPRGEAIRFTAAMVDYWHVISPVARPPSLTVYPEPLDWIFVQQDDLSLEHLRRAEQRLTELLNQDDAPLHDHQTWKRWQLACLANDSERQAAAIALCQNMLQTDRTECLAILWVCARAFGINLRDSERAIHDLLEQGEGNITHILTLAQCYLLTNRARKAARLLDRHHSLFLPDAEVIWSQWKARALILAKDRAVTREVLKASGTDTPSIQLQTIALRVAAERTQDWQPLIDHLARVVAQTSNPHALFDYCEALAQINQWETLAGYAETLISAVTTNGTIHMAALSYYHSQRYEDCLSLLDQYRDRFTHSKIPSQLRRIRTYCKQMIGNIQDAIAEAEENVRDEPSLPNILQLFSLYLSKGDTKQACAVARQLRNRPDVPTSLAFRLAGQVASDDPELARSFLRQAMASEIPDANVATAIHLAFSLGLDDDMAALTQRMQQLAEKGAFGFRQLNLDEAREMFREQYKRNAELGATYARGEVPVHVIAKVNQANLAVLYHQALEQNATQDGLLPTNALLARHASRPMRQAAPGTRPNWCLHMDVTAILLAAHLEILDHVEATFQPIRISSSLVPALLSMREKLLHHQLSRVEHCRQVLELVERGRVQVLPATLPLSNDIELPQEMGQNLTALAEHAQAHNGYLVDFASHITQTTDGTPTAQPHPLPNILVSCRTLTEALRACGELTEAKYHSALSALGTEGVQPAGTIPNPPALLVCAANIPELLAAADLLAPAAERFAVWIEAGELARVRQEIDTYQHRQQLREWLSALIERLHEGLDNQTYQWLPELPPDTTQVRELDPQTAEVEDLLTLLRSATDQQAVLWIDDRNISAFPRSDHAEIIGVTDVLQVLVDVGTLGQDEAYELLIRLRAADVRFIPITSAEIQYHLEHAALVDDRLVEHSALATLRRYASRCLQQGQSLQQEPLQDDTPGPRDEASFLADLVSTVLDSIAEVWMANTPDTVCRARANWIVESLFLTYQMVRCALDPSQVVNTPTPTAATFAGLITRSLGIESQHRDGQISRRQAYFEWLDQHILEPAFVNHPELVSSTAELWKLTVAQVQDSLGEQQHAELAITALYDWFTSLPEGLRTVIEQDPEFMSRLGVFFEWTTTIGDMTFKVSEFYEAAQDAFAGRTATITRLEEGEPVSVQCASTQNDNPFVILLQPVVGPDIRLSNPIFGILQETLEQRAEALRQHRDWFDCAYMEQEQAVAEIVAIESAEQRVRAVLSWKETSTILGYIQLAQRISEGQRLKHSDMLPASGMRMLQHYRLPATPPEPFSFPTMLEAAASILIEEGDLGNTIWRLARFPVALPNTVLEAVRSLSRAEQKELLTILVRTSGSPLSNIHLLRILTSLDLEAPLHRRLINRIVRRLAGAEGKTAWAAYVTILSWSQAVFERWLYASLWPAGLRLAMAWAHADALYVLFQDLGIPPQDVQTMFAEPMRQIGQTILERKSSLRHDCAHPKHVTYERFLLAGLGYGLNTPDTTINLSHRDALASILLPEASLGQAPAFSLYTDTRRMGNILDSFLGQNRGELLAQVLGDTSTDYLNADALREVEKSFIHNIQENPADPEIWATLRFAFGNVPPFPDITASLATALATIDYVKLETQSIGLGLKALATASRIAFVLQHQDLAQTLRSYLSKLISLLGVPPQEKTKVPNTTSQTSNWQEQFIHALDAGFNLALTAVVEDETISAIGSLLAECASLGQAPRSTCRLLVDLLITQIPLQQARQLWPLLIWLRTA